MPPALIAIFAALIPHLPDLVAEGEALFNAVAHGEGGSTKVATTAAALAQLSATASTVAAATHAATAAQNNGAAANGG